MAVPLLGCGVEGPSVPSTDVVSSKIEPAPTRSESRYEIDFMTDMIDHHQMALEMAELCLDKAVHEELRALCSNIIAAQSAEIQQMQSWLYDWYGISYEPMMKPGAERQLAKMAEMTSSEFEIEFMEDMIGHHSKALTEGERCLDRAYHGELIELCESIIEAQSAEIELMESWLCEWYGDCG